MTNIKKYFDLAKSIAVKGDTRIRRQHRLGAVGIRSDGATVTANNLPNTGPEIHAHAEARVVRKLDWGGTVFVVRIMRNGDFGLARPCKGCTALMKYNGVKKCYYSINNNEYGVIIFK